MDSIVRVPGMPAEANLLTGDCVFFGDCAGLDADLERQARSLLCETARCPEASLDPGGLVVTVELGRGCNARCAYCYQNNRKTREAMDEATISMVADYIKNALAMRPERAVEVRLIGGEPLLYRSETELLADAVETIRDVQVRWHVDTNGLLPMGWLFDRLEDLEVVVCLSLPGDHDRLGRGPAKTVFDCLAAVEPKASQRLIARYNCHEGNIADFGRFLDWIEPLRGHPVFSVMVENLWNYPYNDERFHNGLSNEAFSKWAGNTAVPQLLGRGWPVGFQNREAPRLCQAHGPFSCKVYADGSVALCDLMDAPEARVFLEDIVDCPERLNEVYSDIKATDPLQDSSCVRCPALQACGGRAWCRRDQCDPSVLKRVLGSNLAVLSHSLRKEQLDVRP